LRSALAARDWHQAGAIIWQLRQLDGERFTLELEHYTNEQVRKGGYGMALETEQRLEALRLWAREGLERFPTAWPALILVMSQGFPAGEAAKTLAQHYKEWSFDTKRGLIYRGDIKGPTESFDCTCLDWEHTKEEGVRVLRSDMRDVLWSVFQSIQAPSDV